MIYLNNAATSFPKFPEVIETMNNAISNGLLFCNRDSISFPEIEKTIFDLRVNISNILHAKKSHAICLSSSDTISLNMLIFGQTYKKGDVVLTSTREHNSVSRPLAQLEKRGVLIKKIPFIENQLDFNFLNTIIKKYREKIKYGIFTHANNVTGDVIDCYKLGNILFKNNIKFILDAAQSIGIINIDVEKMFISALTFAGHKGLNGPQGTGGFYIRNDFLLTPILFGGTGNNSSETNPPIIFPDSFEVGTPPIHNLLGLASSVKKINEIGFNNYASKQQKIGEYLYNQLTSIPNIIIYGSENKTVPIVSVNIIGKSCKQGGYLLGAKGIPCRTGYHCSALGIKDIGATKFDGTVRFSCGYYTTKNEIDFLVKNLTDICKEPSSSLR